MNTTVQTRRTSVPFVTAVRPQRTLQITGLPLPVRLIWSTPRQLRAFVAAIVCASAAFYFASTHAVSRSREAIHSVAEECAPSILAAQELRSAFTDFDANLENVLLSEPDSPDAKAARDAADARHRELASTLVTAAQNITFGDDEKIPITTMVNSFATYESLMAKARTLDGKADKAGALAASREAMAHMDETIIPAAEALDKANQDVLDRTYSRQKFNAQGAIAILILCGFVTLGLLVTTQVYLFRRTHRLLNPALLCATLIAGFQLGNSALENIRAANQLRIAVDDAFVSVHLISKVRAVAYSANGEESRYLFDREKAREHERAFFAAADSIAGIPPGSTTETIADAVRSAGSDSAAAAALPPGFTGLLADELRNLTFPGERESAAEALRTFGNYRMVDRAIRVHEKEGRHPAAVQLCLSYEEGGSNRVFADFDRALGNVLQINQVAFEKAKSDSMQTLSGGEFSIAITTLLMVAATIAGFWPRIREFQA